MIREIEGKLPKHSVRETRGGATVSRKVSGVLNVKRQERRIDKEGKKHQT